MGKIFILYIASIFLILQYGKKEVHGIAGVRWGYPAFLNEIKGQFESRIRI